MRRRSFFCLCLFWVTQLHADGSFIPDILKGGKWDYAVQLDLLVYLEEDPDGAYRSVSNASFSPNYYKSWNEGKDAFHLSPFININQRESVLNYVDLSEMYWSHLGSTWLTRTGVIQEKWGNTYAFGVVDVINTGPGIYGSLFELPNYGQPMVHFSRDFTYQGSINFYLLGGFRENRYPKTITRPSFPVEFDDSNTVIENESEYYQGLDYAFRWIFPVENWQVGLSYFNGISRGNGWVVSLDEGTVETQVILSPIYTSVEQIGLELSRTHEGLTFNFEGAYKTAANGFGYGSAVVGFEYEFGYFELLNTNIHGVLQYLHDDRKGDQYIGVYRENDINVAVRLSFNDEFNTSAVFGSIIDVNTTEQVYLAKVDMSVNDQLTLSLTGAYIFIPVEFDESSATDISGLLDVDLNQVVSQIPIEGALGLDSDTIPPELIDAIQNSDVSVSDLGLANLDQLQYYNTVLADEYKLRALENESFIKFSIRYYF